jgi:hypothetical protein
VIAEVIPTLSDEEQSQQIIDRLKAKEKGRGKQLPGTQAAMPTFEYDDGTPNEDVIGASRIITQSPSGDRNCHGCDKEIKAGEPAVYTEPMYEEYISDAEGNPTTRFIPRDKKPGGSAIGFGRPHLRCPECAEKHGYPLSADEIREAHAARAGENLSPESGQVGEAQRFKEKAPADPGQTT